MVDATGQQCYTSHSRSYLNREQTQPMPDGRTHDILTIAVGACAAPLVVSLPAMNPLHYGILLGSYLASGLIFSNDLDLHSSNYMRWGLLRFIWLPYQKVVRHRSWVSHSLVVGPLLRVVYFGLAVLLLLWLALAILAFFGNTLNPRGTFDQLTSRSYQFIISHPTATIYFLLGFVMGGAVHTVADVVSTWRKRHRIRW